MLLVLFSVCVSVDVSVVGRIVYRLSLVMSSRLSCLLLCQLHVASTVGISARSCQGARYVTRLDDRCKAVVAASFEDLCDGVATAWRLEGLVQDSSVSVLNGDSVVNVVSVVSVVGMASVVSVASVVVFYNASTLAIIC